MKECWYTRWSSGGHRSNQEILRKCCVTLHRKQSCGDGKHECLLDTVIYRERLQHQNVWQIKCVSEYIAAK